MKLLIGGDFVPGKWIGSALERKNYSFLDDFRNLAKDADLSIINLECPFIKNGEKPIEKYGPNLGCDPKAANAVAYAGIGLVTLANNHIKDYGESALRRTIKCCESAGVATVGVGSDNLDASKPFIFNHNGESVGIINCCEHEFSVATESSAGANALDPIKQYYQIKELKREIDYVIVIVHGGHENFNLPSLRMQKNYRFFVDAGADAVINHHQHCYSGYELYKEKPIFYGLGNLCFEDEGNSPESWFEGYLVSINLEKNITFEIHPYTQFKDDRMLKLSHDSKILDKIEELNTVISDETLLKESLKAYYEKNSINIPMVFDLYTNKYLLKLRYHHLLPSFFNKKMKLRIQNNILCESHFDKLKYFFTRKQES